MAQYISKGRLEALGFEREGNWFFLKKKVWNQLKRKLELVEIGRVKLDTKGYVLDSRGFEKLSDGKLVFIQMPACW